MALAAFMASACADGSGEPRSDGAGDLDADVGEWVAPPPSEPTALGPPHALRGAWMPQSEDAIATTEGGWVVSILLHDRALTATSGAGSLELAPSAAAGVSRVVLLPIGLDGAPRQAVEVGALEPGLLGYASVTACGGDVWGAAMTSDSRQSWVFRARADLSDLRVARFVAIGDVPAEEVGGRRAAVYRIDCIAGRPMFELGTQGPTEVTLPSGATIAATTEDGEADWLVDAAALIDHERFTAYGTPGVQLDALTPGADGTVLYTAYEIGGVRPRSVQVLRHDPRTGASTPFVAPPLVTDMFAMRYAEVLDGPDAGRLGVLCARAQGPIELEGARVTDPLAGDFCVTFRDGHVLAHRAFREIIPHTAVFDDGRLWLSGALVGHDPAVGEVADGMAAFVAAFDPTTMEPIVSALVHESAGTISQSALQPAPGDGDCPTDGVLLETRSESPPYGLEGILDVRVTRVGVDGTSCAARVVRADVSPRSSGYAPLLLSARGSTCTEARRLALLAPNVTLELAGAAPLEVGEGFVLQAFQPAGCMRVAP